MTILYVKVRNPFNPLLSGELLSIVEGCVNDGGRAIVDAGDISPRPIAITLFLNSRYPSDTSLVTCGFSGSDSLSS